MSRTAIYTTSVAWKGEHWGHIVMAMAGDGLLRAAGGAGAPGCADARGCFVASANTCIMMMFIWAAERYKLNLLSYDCQAEGPSDRIGPHRDIHPPVLPAAYRVSAGRRIQRQCTPALSALVVGAEVQLVATRSDPRSSSSRR